MLQWVGVANIFGSGGSDFSGNWTTEHHGHTDDTMGADGDRAESPFRLFRLAKDDIGLLPI